ncbi:WD40-repeat-containing domain protein [Nannochloropsis gaditana]|uniref:WD40-repeat-containing domain protein n=1 Tax=Nannochloropsis gaditana TaxID=72520 RepID=W7U227_9STRA|nr:WD40-repeat-containing domain protein [Nannochloropsis gaditana]
MRFRVCTADACHRSVHGGNTSSCDDLDTSDMSSDSRFSKLPKKKRLLIQIKYTGTRMPDDSHFFDDAAYISHIRDEAATKEATIFHTAHCPQNRYLLASSNKGRIAIWDLSFYLFPAASASLLTTCPSLSFASRASPLLTRGFSRHLRQYECRMFPAALRRKGFPCLSIQVSERAINHVMFLGEGSTSPLLVLAGDDGIYVWPWAHILKLLSQAIGEDGGMDQDCTQGIPGNSCITQDLGAPSALLKALPSQEAWPFLTESNQVAPSFHSSSSTSPSVCFSACGDALVRQWDLETQKCASVLIGHTGFSMVSAARTDCAIQGVAFEEEKIISVGNERQALHWARPGLGKAARVTTDIPSVFSVNVRRSPPNGDGVTVYAGRADHVSVFVHPEHSAFNLKFR